MAFTDLVNTMVKSFITPLIAAIFRGVSFEVRAGGQACVCGLASNLD